MNAGERFFASFVAELRAEGRTPAEIAPHVWKPYRLEQLGILGPQRDPDLDRLALHAADLDTVPLAQGQALVWREQKLAFVLFPGFTHETLRNYSWHEEIQGKDSPHHVVMLHPGAPPREEVFSQGDGLKFLYLRYPRSNADSRHVVPALFEMLRDCACLRSWIAEGRKLIFVGYSYGAPLALELLADMNAGELRDDAILANTLAFLGLCGDIGGSYLADDVLCDTPKLLNLKKALAFCQRHPFIAKLAGLGTEQLMADIEDGVRSLGHVVRQARLREYAPRLPAHLHYFSVSALLPLADYRRRWWHFNLDDYAMYRQAQITDPVTVYHDGQVALPDHLVPTPPQIAAERIVHLGAVRTHHWGVAYKTFNFGRNRFPRRAFHRALLRTMLEHIMDHPSALIRPNRDGRIDQSR